MVTTPCFEALTTRLLLLRDLGCVVFSGIGFGRFLLPFVLGICDNLFPSIVV